MDCFFFAKLPYPVRHGIVPEPLLEKTLVVYLSIARLVGETSLASNYGTRRAYRTRIRGKATE